MTYPQTNRINSPLSAHTIVSIILLSASLLIHIQLYGQQGRKDTSSVKSEWTTGSAIGPSFPLSTLRDISHTGFHTTSFVEWQSTGHFFVRGLIDFSTYGFTSSYQLEGFTLMQEGNRTSVMALLNVGYRRRFGRWLPAIYLGNGLSYNVEPALQLDVSNQIIRSTIRKSFHYALHFGVQLTYLMRATIRPFIELSLTYFPRPLIFGNTFLVFQPSLGIKVPLKRITSILKSK